MKNKVKTLIFTSIILLSISSVCYAENEITLHETEFKTTSNVNPNTTGSIWNSSGIFQYEEDGMKVEFNSGDLEKIGNELTQINSDLIEMNESVANADTALLARKTDIATKLNNLYKVMNTKLSTTLPTLYSSETTFETMINDLESAKNILNESLNQKLTEKYNAGVTAGKSGMYTKAQYDANYINGYNSKKSNPPVILLKDGWGYVNSKDAYSQDESFTMSKSGSVAIIIKVGNNDSQYSLYKNGVCIASEAQYGGCEYINVFNGIPAGTTFRLYANTSGGSSARHIFFSAVAVYD